MGKSQETDAPDGRVTAELDQEYAQALRDGLVREKPAEPLPPPRQVHVIYGGRQAYGWPKRPWTCRDESRVKPSPKWPGPFQRWLSDYNPACSPDTKIDQPDWDAVRRVLLGPPFNFEPAKIDSLSVVDVVFYLSGQASGDNPDSDPPDADAASPEVLAVVSEDDGLKPLYACHAEAYRAYQFSVQHNPEKRTRDQLYDWLQNCPLPDDQIPHEIKEYDLVKLATWKTYVHAAERHYKQTGIQPPHSQASKSVVQQGHVETVQSDEWARPPSTGDQDHIDNLLEIASKLFTATPGSERDDLWERTGKILEALGESGERTSRFRQKHDIHGLLTWAAHKEKSLEQAGKK